METKLEKQLKLLQREAGRFNEMKVLQEGGRKEMEDYDDDDEDDELNEYINEGRGGDEGPNPDEFIIMIQATPPPKKINQQQQQELDEFLRDRERVYRERRERVAQVCEREGPQVSYGSVREAPLHRLRWLHSHRLVMCFNAKVGTSTWTQYLVEVAKPGLLSNSSHWHYTAQRVLKPPYRRTSQQALDLLDKSGKVIMVRHPFARIVSAYKDKIVTRSFKKLSKFIITKYRPESSSNNDDYPVPSFKEFVEYLVDFSTPSDDVRDKRNSRTNRHWFHYYANCAVCDIHYDVIGKMESVHEDTRYIMEKFKLGLSDSVWNNHRGKKSSEDAALAMFKEVPRALTVALYQRYRLDFEMFGYNITNFLAPS